MFTLFFFFFNDTATTEIYTLSLHDALPITIAGEIQPMLCGTAFKNKGVQRMLDAVIELMPSPVDIPPVKGTDDDEKPVTRKADDNEKFSALAFKLMTDPF